VLLVSTDPAPSIADALELRIGDDEQAVPGAPGLVARQMDASAAFLRFRDAYASRIDAIFDALVARGLDAAHDHAILRDLLALAPPGIDELYALASIGETLEASRFDLIIVDPAPTGHLLRLLEMPEVALDWTHRLMRLMLKYREIAALADTAHELLAFAQRTRALHDLLHDPHRAALVVVALDEPLVRAESERLVAAVRALDIHVAALVWNRVGRAPSPLPTTPPVAQVVAPSVEPAPTGLEALRDWSVHWAELPLSND
jgi:arsenite-transporting ATPase